MTLSTRHSSHLPISINSNYLYVPIHTRSCSYHSTAFRMNLSITYLLLFISIYLFIYLSCQVRGVCRIHDCFSVECCGYDAKQFEGEVPVMLVLWRMWSIPLLLSLPGPVWPGVASPYYFLSIGQIELNSVYILKWIALNRTVFDFETPYLC